MLGWNVTRSVAAGADSGARSITVWTAGNSSVPLMKHAGKAHDSPGWPPLGNGGNSDQRDDVEDDDAGDQQQPAIARRPSRRARGVGDVGAWAPGSVATCSLDTLPPHTGARRDAALGFRRSGRCGRAR